MVLKDIIALSGESGLFRFVAHGKNAVIVEHLETLKRHSVFDSNKMTSLDDIAVYTEAKDMPLSQVFDLVFDSAEGKPAIDSKADGAQMKKWFEGVLPQYNKDRVYVSDIRKVALWYNILHKLDMLVKETPEEKAEATSAEAGMPEKQEEKPAEKKKRKPAQKKKTE